MRNRMKIMTALAAVLLAATWGMATTASAIADPERALGNVSYPHESEAIGTGSMSETDRSESPASSESTEISLEEGRAVGPHSVLGTGSMPLESGNHPDAGISGQGGLIRPDVDFP